MSCNDYQVWVSCELDGELDAEKTRTLHRHLASCEECRRVQEDFRVNRLLLHAMAPVAAPRDGWQRLAQRMAEEGDPAAASAPHRPAPIPQARSARRSRLSMLTWSPRTRRTFEAAAGFMLVFVGVLLWLGYTDQDAAPSLSAPPAAVELQAATLMRGHAMLQAANPIGDRSAWNYLASETGQLDPVDAPPDAIPGRYESDFGTAH